MTPVAPTPEQTAKLGFFVCVFATSLWGVQALYLYALGDVGLLEVLSWRAVTTAVFLFFILHMLKLLPFVWQSFSPKVLLISLGFSLLLFFQWILYLWAVTHGKVVESSIAYFLSPLFTVMLALVLLREKLRPWQWLAVALAGIGLALQALLLGGLPWIAVMIGGLFALYSVLRKLTPIGSLHGLFIEHAILFAPAFAYIAWMVSHRQSAFQIHGIDIQLLLLGSGVFLSIPVIAFFVSLRMINISTAGLLSYLTPLIQFALGIFYFKEPTSLYQLASISVIWLALIVYTLEGQKFFRAQRRLRHQAAAAGSPEGLKAGIEAAAAGEAVAVVEDTAIGGFTPDTTLVEENPEEQSAMPLEPAMAASSAALDFAHEDSEPEKSKD